MNSRILSISPLPAAISAGIAIANGIHATSMLDRAVWVALATTCLIIAHVLIKDRGGKQ